MKSKSERRTQKRPVYGKQRKSWLKISKLSEVLLCWLLLSLLSFGCSSRLKETVSKQQPMAYFKGILTIVDVEDPRQPKIVSSTPLPCELNASNRVVLFRAAVWKQSVLVTSPYGVHLLDIKNQEKPRLLWNLPLATFIGKVAVFEDYAFFPTDEGLYVLQIKTPLQPQWVFRAEKKAHLNVPLFDLKIKGRYAYTLDRYRYLHVLDLSEPVKPKVVASHTVSGFSSFLFFRASDERVQPILQKPGILSLIDKARAFHLDQLDLPADFSAQLSNQSHLLEIIAADWVVKVRISKEYICLFFPHSDGPYQLWMISLEKNRIYLLDVALEYTKYLYTSGKRKLPKNGSITDIRAFKEQLVFISQDNWLQTVKVEREEWGNITDFQLSENLVYITLERGVLFIAKLSTEGLEGIAVLENLPQQPQSLTLDKHYLYVLGREFPSEVQKR